MNGLDVFAANSGYQDIALMWQYSLAILIVVVLLSPIMYSFLTNTVRTIEVRLKKKQAE